MAEELIGQGLEEKFLERLSKARSNLPDMGDGGRICRTLVKPRSVTLEKVANHFAISSLVTGEEKQSRFFSFRAEMMNYEKMKRDDRLLVMGQVRVTSDVIPDPGEFSFGLISSEKDIFRTWVSEHKGKALFDTLKERGSEILEKGEEEMEKTLTTFSWTKQVTHYSLLCQLIYLIFSYRDIFSLISATCKYNKANSLDSEPTRPVISAGAVDFVLTTPTPRRRHGHGFAKT